jgi:hypothetical protein
MHFIFTHKSPPFSLYLLRQKEDGRALTAWMWLRLMTLGKLLWRDMNLWIPNASNFSSSWGSISFWRGTCCMEESSILLKVVWFHHTKILFSYFLLTTNSSSLSSQHSHAFLKQMCITELYCRSALRSAFVMNSVPYLCLYIHPIQCITFHFDRFPYLEFHLFSNCAVRP